MWVTKYMPYNDRLTWLQLPSLELKRIRKDLIMCYKIMHGHVALELSDFFVLSNNSRTRGHNSKLLKKQFCSDVCKYFCNNRVIVVDMWNNLPEACISSQTIINFKSNLMLCDLNLYSRGSYERTVEVPD